MVFLFCLFTSTVSYALPTLQLDIAGGTYDVTTETIVTDQPVFTLYALLSDNGKESYLGETFYVSMAIMPPMAEGDMNLGSVVFDGHTIIATDDMEYGTPPLETGDLPGHGIYENYYSEFSFMFDEDSTATPYNTQDNAGQGPLSTSEPGFYFQGFKVDISGLAAGTGVHFDLYNTAMNQKNELVLDQSAPFSHDAQGTGTGGNVPEPSSVFLVSLGFGLLLAGSVRRVKTAKQHRQ